MMTCKKCKYFETETDNPKPNGYGWCNHTKMVDDLYVRPPKDLTMPTDGVYCTCDESRGELMVGPDFGCIHFELKQL